MASTRQTQSTLSKIGAAIARTLFVTLLFALLGMGIGLFAGIIGMVVLSFIKNVHPDMQLAYLKVAFPTAAVFGAIALLYNVVQEVRRAARPR